MQTVLRAGVRATTFLALACVVTMAQTVEHREERFRFSHPAGWEVSRGANIPGVVSLQVNPRGAAVPRMLIMYRRLAPTTRAHMLHSGYMEEFVKDDVQIAWRRVGYDKTDNLAAGEAMTTVFRRDRFQPMTSIATTICSAGDSVLMVFEYDHTQGNAEWIRDVFAKTLVLGDGSIAGTWHSQGTVLTLDGSGRASLNWSTGRYATESRVGAWALDGRHRLVFRWKAGSARASDTVECYVTSMTGARMMMKCSDLPGEVTYVRH